METMKRFCALLLSVVMSASLCAPAVAAEVGDMAPVCGMEEHVHTGDCRFGDPLGDLISGSGAVKGETVYVVHQHGSGCYDGEGNLACVLMDEGYMSRYPDVVIVHKHDRNCTDCTLPESSYEVTDGTESVDGDSVYDHDSPHYVVGVPGDAHEGVNGVPEDMDLGYHTHWDGCDEGCTLPVVVEYAAAEGDAAYSCGKTEHTHVDVCFSANNDSDEPGMSTEDPVDDTIMSGIMSTITSVVDGVRVPAAAGQFGTCNWIFPNAIGLDASNTLLVGDTDLRYVSLGIGVNLGSSRYDTGSVVIEVPYDLGLGRTGSGTGSSSPSKYYAMGGIASYFTAKVDTVNNKVTLTNNKVIAAGSHESLNIQYRLDCWNIASELTQAAPTCTVNGTSVTLPAVRVKTNSRMDIMDLYYPFNGFVGVDGQERYLSNWSRTYLDYFGLTESEFKSGNYVYDIMGISVRPSGQQPYGISGTFVPGRYQTATDVLAANRYVSPSGWDGELCGIAYMAGNTVLTKIPFSGGDAGYTALPNYDNTRNNMGVQLANSHRWNKYTFSIDYADLGIVSKMTDSGDIVSDRYNLYFLVRYPANSESIKNTGDDQQSGNTTLHGTVSLDHVLVDSKRSLSDFNRSWLYLGFRDSVNYSGNIYSSTYDKSVSTVDSKTGLSALLSTRKAMLSLTTDFFCLNENRANHNQVGSTGKYAPWTLNAIVDGLFLSHTGADKRSAMRLGPGDYRISTYGISIIDDFGASSCGSDGSWKVGWSDSSVDHAIARGDGDAPIYVYGSESLYGDDWTLIAETTLRKVYASGQYPSVDDGAVKPVSSSSNFVRLKVEYSGSKLTTAIRIRYDVEILPTGNTASKAVAVAAADGNLSSLETTAWSAYTAYSEDGQVDLCTSKSSVDLDATTGQVIRADDSKHFYPGYSSSVYPYRNFMKSKLGKSSDDVGMAVTQALYDSAGNLIGQSSQADGAYSLVKDANGISAVRYSVVGFVTNYSDNMSEIASRRQMDIDEGSDTAYASSDQRYYVLLPVGLRYVRGSIGPYNELLGVGHKYISNISCPKIGMGDSSGRGLTSMYWNTRSSNIPVKTAMVGNRQLVIIDRPAGYSDGDVSYIRPGNFSTESMRHMWGFGVSFAAEPVSDLPSGSYETLFAHQFLTGKATSAGTGAASLFMYGGDSYASMAEAFGASGDRMDDYAIAGDGATFTAIRTAFRNWSGSGGSLARVSVRAGEPGDYPDAYGDAAHVDPADGEDTYNYALTYEIRNGTSTDVVLWDFVEAYDRDGLSSEWFGEIVGADAGSTGAKVYVNESMFDPADYLTTNSSKGRDYTVLQNGQYGWKAASASTDWSKVKSVAFWFQGKRFDANDEAASKATVYLKMRAPEDPGVAGGEGPYTTYNEILFSDKHSDTNAEATVLSNAVSVDMDFASNTPFGNEMPKTGGAGTVLFLLCGIACLAVAGVAYGVRRRRDDEQGG